MYRGGRNVWWCRALARTFVHCHFYVYNSDVFYVITVHTFCDYPCSDSVKLGTCQILLFKRKSACVKLIGSDWTAYGLGCTAFYVPDISDTNEQSSLWDIDLSSSSWYPEIETCVVYLSLVRRLALPSGSTELQLWYHPHIRRHLFYCTTWISPCCLPRTGCTQIHNCLLYTSPSPRD